MKKYTLSQIKKAFWAEFHESGELWFDYLDTTKENERSTQTHWSGFEEELNRVEKR